MTPSEERDMKNMAEARQHLQKAFELVKQVADNHGGKVDKLNQMYMLIGSVHNDVSNYGIKLPGKQG